MKKILSLFLAALMLLSCVTITAAAAEDGQTVSVTPSIGGTTEPINLTVGETCEVTVKNTDILKFSTVTYSVSVDPNESNITVSDNSVEVKTTGNSTFTITANSCGEATVTVSYTGVTVTYKATITVNVAHSYDEGVVTKEATESETGEVTYTCSICGDKRTESTPVLEHNHDYVVTSMQDGANVVKTSTCSVCRDVVTEIIAPELKDGAVTLSAGMSEADVSEALFAALVSNANDLSEAYSDYDPSVIDWEYESTGYDTSTGLLPHTAWGSVNGFTSSTTLLITTNYTHGALKDAGAGDYSVRIGTDGEGVTLTVTDLPEFAYTLNDGAYTAGLVYNEDMSIDANATAAAIYAAVVSGSAEDAPAYTVTWDAGVLFASNYIALDATYLTESFGEGTYTIKITWAAAAATKETSVTAEVTMTDGRAETSIVLVEGAQITYNMDAAVMEQEIYDTMIDWENSALPKDASIDDFTIEYYASYTSDLGGLIGSLVDTSSIEGLTSTYAPIAGRDGTIAIAQMGAGEQTVKISYNGDNQNKSSAAEGTLTVNKANVTVKINSVSQYVDKVLPDNFVALDPDDPALDIYVVYAGITSSVTTAIYVQLPASYTTNSTTFQLLDKAVETVYGTSLSTLMNDGMTVGELRDMLSQIIDNETVLAVMELAGMDTDSFSAILDVLDVMPSLLDSTSVAFGTPSKAGAYMVGAVTNNANYNTAYGVGALLLRMRLTGNKLTWSETIGTMTAAEAAEFDFSAVLSHDGDVTISQSNVKYRYTGITSSRRIYSSTVPPTQAGTYVVTAYTSGGNYYASPITRSFKISG